MCHIPGGLLQRAFPPGACYARRSDGRGPCTGRRGCDLKQEENKGKIAYFGGISKCKFKGKIVPGDKVRLETKIIKAKGPMGIGEATDSVDGKVVVSAELTFMVG